MKQQEQQYEPLQHTKPVETFKCTQQTDTHQHKQDQTTRLKLNTGYSILQNQRQVTDNNIFLFK